MTLRRSLIRGPLRVLHRQIGFVINGRDRPLVLVLCIELPGDLSHDPLLEF